jgi:hypothetical protein
MLTEQRLLHLAAVLLHVWRQAVSLEMAFWAGRAASFQPCGTFI